MENTRISGTSNQIQPVLLLHGGSTGPASLGPRGACSSQLAVLPWSTAKPRRLQAEHHLDHIDVQLTVRADVSITIVKQWCKKWCKKICSLTKLMQSSGQLPLKTRPVCTPQLWNDGLQLPNRHPASGRPKSQRSNRPQDEANQNRCYIISINFNQMQISRFPSPFLRNMQTISTQQKKPSGFLCWSRKAKGDRCKDWPCRCPGLATAYFPFTYSHPYIK